MSRERTHRRGLLVGLSAASLGVVYGYDLSNIAGVLANAIGRQRSMALVATGYAVFALLGAMSVSAPASASASARWYGCTRARASRPGCGRWARARC